MRVVASGNLTVELIRAQRFDVACYDHAIDQHEPCRRCPDDQQQRVDRVELSPEALASDPWADDAKRAEGKVISPMSPSQASMVEEAPDEPEQLSPVVGSPALGGLGIAWVVPGTLLDVLA